jgi:hypothetical protein
VSTQTNIRGTDTCPAVSELANKRCRTKPPQPDLGAKKVDVGQPTGASWVVLADPEDNEFCLLRSLAPGHFDAGTGAPTSEQPLPD